MANLITTTNAPAPNAINSLRGDTQARNQTVLTPQIVVDAVAEVFGGRIQMDPVWAPGSLTNPVHAIMIDPSEIRVSATQLANDLAKQLGYLPDAASEAVSIVCDGKAVGKSSKPAGKIATLVIEGLRKALGKTSGHHHENWIDGTFINPPFASRGPEAILASFADFCRAFAASKVDVILLGPGRTHRAWWRRDVMLSGASIAWLDVITFVGHKQSFPAPLTLAYRGREHDRFRRVMLDRLGCDVTPPMGRA